MKKSTFITIFSTCLLLSSCFSSNDNSVSLNNSGATSNNSNSGSQKNDVIVNTVYEEIADDKVGLKNATQEDLDKILQEEVRINNTPTSKYPFFEQSTTKKADIQEIKKAGGLEVTRGNVFTYGIDDNYSFISVVLSDNDSLLSFSQNGTSFFFLDGDYKAFIDKMKIKFTDFKVNNNSSDNIYAEFSYESKKYMLDLSIGKGITRDDLDNILQTNQKTKVAISLVK